MSIHRQILFALTLGLAALSSAKASDGPSQVFDALLDQASLIDAVGPEYDLCMQDPAGAREGSEGCFGLGILLSTRDWDGFSDRFDLLPDNRARYQGIARPEPVLAAIAYIKGCLHSSQRACVAVNNLFLNGSERFYSGTYAFDYTGIYLHPDLIAETASPAEQNQRGRLLGAIREWVCRGIDGELGISTCKLNNEQRAKGGGMASFLRHAPLTLMQLFDRYYDIELLSPDVDREAEAAYLGLAYTEDEIEQAELLLSELIEQHRSKSRD